MGLLSAFPHKDVSCGRNSEVEEQFVGNAAGQAGREGVLVGVGTV